MREPGRIKKFPAPKARRAKNTKDYFSGLRLLPAKVKKTICKAGKRARKGKGLAEHKKCFSFLSADRAITAYAANAPVDCNLPTMRPSRPRCEC